MSPLQCLLTRPSRRFLAAFALFMLAGVLGVSGWNYLVDPFDIYHGSTWHGFNHFKARTSGAYDRMVKARQIARRRPRVLILGTSRADWALDPAHPGLQAVSTNTYNASLAGATIYEVHRYVQHAHAIRPLKLVIVGLDVEMFDAERQRASFSERRLAARRDGGPNPSYRFADIVPTLFSQDALRANHDTRHDSRQHLEVTREQILARGSVFRESASPEKRWQAYRLGVHQARANLGQLRAHWDTVLDRMQYYEELVSFAHRHGIRLVFFISPYHLSHLEVFRQTHNWEAFEDWKRELVSRNHRLAREHDARPFQLWDFSGYHEVATEPHPSPDDPYRVMTWYRESSHYRKITGDRILDRLLGVPIDLPYFGVELTAEHLEYILHVQRRFAADFLRRRRRPAPAP